MLRGCVAGCGNIGPIHAASLEKRGALAAVCDIRRERMERFNAEKYTSLDEALLRGSFDIVHICTPHYLHFPMTKSALKAGKYVVLEKPVGITREEMQALMSGEGSERVCIMLQNRKNPCFTELKKLAGSGKYGRIKQLCGFLTWSRTKEYYLSDDWRGKWATEGGALLINQAVHTIDLLCCLGGGYESLTGGISSRKLSGVIEAEDTADAVIKMKNGAEACFYATNCAMENSLPRIEVAFENGHVLNYMSGMLFDIFEDNAEIICRDSAIVPGKSYWGAGHDIVINEFYDYCEGKTDSFLRLSEARDAMNVIFDMYEGRKTK